MSILTAFEELSLTPFCSDKIKEDFIDNLPTTVSKINFLKGDQLSLRMSLSSKGHTKFADAIDVVAF
jgi:hypothetical protein